jgi:Flp pilus assembly protein CpaB
VQAGDRVDVIGEFQVSDPDHSGAVRATPKGGGTDAVFATATILQDVEVLALGQKGEAPAIGSGPGSANGVSPSLGQAEAKTVTLALTPDEAQRAFLAEQLGTLRLTIRRPGDSEIVQVPPQPNDLSAFLPSS